MTTRQQLHGHVRKAIEDDLNRQDAKLHCESTWLDFDLNEAAFAAIEAVYKAIGDHQLAVMIGDTGAAVAEAPPRTRAVRVTVEEPDELQILQADDEDGED